MTLFKLCSIFLERPAQNLTWGCPIAGVTLKGRRGPTTPALTVNVVSLLTPLKFGLPPTLPTKEDLPFKSTVKTVELSTVTPSGRTWVLANSRSPVLSTLARTDTKPVWSGIIGIWINRNEFGATMTSIFRSGKSCGKKIVEFFINVRHTAVRLSWFTYLCPLKMAAQILHCIS